MENKLNGFIAAPLTGFFPDGSINLEVIPRYANMLYDNGVSGVFVNGTTGEGQNLTMEERQILARCWIDSAPKDLKVIIHVGYAGQSESRILAIHAAESGADGIGQIGPLSSQPETLGALVDYAEATASATPDQPYYYYHMPSMNNVNFPMVEFLDLAESTIPNLAGIKYTHDDIDDFRKCIEFGGGKYEIFFGRDEFLIDGLSAGAVGAVGSTYNIMAPLYHELVNSFWSADLENAQRLQLISADTCRHLYATGGFGSGLKAILRVIGLDLGLMRDPQVNLSPETVKNLELSLQNTGAINFLNKV